MENGEISGSSQPGRRVSQACAGRKPGKVGRRFGIESRIEQRTDLVLCFYSYNTTMFIPYIHDRVEWKSAGIVCLVMFVNIHNRTVDLFTPRGAGEVIKGVPLAEVARVG